MQVAVVAIVPVALIWAANTAMLGLSRHVYVLATNRQIPSWLGKLNRRFRTTHVAIVVAAVFAFGLIVPTDITLLGGPVRVRGDDRVHDRPPLGDQAAHRPAGRASARSGCRSTSATAGRGSRCRPWSRRC